MKRILIIEDQQSIAELERDYLEIDGFRVDIKSNGKEGLTQALEQKYDLILLDLMLPDMDGFNICRKIRKEKIFPFLLFLLKEGILIKFVVLDWELMIISVNHLVQVN